MLTKIAVLWAGLACDCDRGVIRGVIRGVTRAVTVL